ncbi:hypothetical protein EMIT048CA2_130022 [Pseudomonas chlororaphis]
MARTIAAFGSGYIDWCDRTIGFSPVAAAEHREAAIDREAGAALGCAGGPATSVARTIAAFGSGYTDRVHRTIGLPPCSRCRACEAAIDRAAGAALELAGGPADLSQPSAAAPPIACTELSGCPL